MKSRDTASLDFWKALLDAFPSTSESESSSSSSFISVDFTFARTTFAAALEPVVDFDVRAAELILDDFGPGFGIFGAELDETDDDAGEVDVEFLPEIGSKRGVVVVVVVVVVAVVVLAGEFCWEAAAVDVDAVIASCRRKLALVVVAVPDCLKNAVIGTVLSAEDLIDLKGQLLI